MFQYLEDITIRSDKSGNASLSLLPLSSPTFIFLIPILCLRLNLTLIYPPMPGCFFSKPWFSF